MKEKVKNTMNWKEILIYVLIFVFIVIIMPRYVWGKTIVDGNSMETTLKDKEWLLVDKLSYHFKNPERFDIVVIYSPMVEGENWIKRVVGLPGETIQILEGKIYINGDILESDLYGKDSIDYTGIAKKPYVIPDGSYFLMGDNRVGDHSWDSRYKEIGSIKKEDIWGKAIFRTRPLKRIGIVK